MAKDYNAFYTNRSSLAEVGKWAKVFGLKLNPIVPLTEWLNFEIELCTKQSKDISLIPSIKKYIVTISTHTWSNGAFVKRDTPLIAITDHSYYELENVDMCCIYDDNYINFYVKCNNSNEYVSGILKHSISANLFTYFNYENFEVEITSSTPNSVFVSSTPCQKIPRAKNDGSTTPVTITGGSTWTKVNEGYVWGVALYDCVVAVTTTIVITNDTDENKCDVFLDIYNRDTGSSTNEAYKYMGRTSRAGTSTVTTVINKAFKKGDIIKYDLFARCSNTKAVASVERYRMSAFIIPGDLA